MKPAKLLLLRRGRVLTPASRLRYRWLRLRTGNALFLQGAGPEGIEVLADRRRRRARRRSGIQRSGIMVVVPAWRLADLIDLGIEDDLRMRS